MRNLSTVIRIIRQFIPSTEKGAHADLQKVQDSILYTPPECMGEKWREAADALTLFGETTKESPEWLKVVGTIWLDMRMEDSKLW